MTQIPNATNVTIREILPRLQASYPGAVIKKPWLSPEMISIPVDNYRLFVRPLKRRNKLVLDFHPPLVWNLVGALGTAFVVSFLLSFFFKGLYVVSGLFIALAFLAGKAIFKTRIKARLELFRQDVDRAMKPDSGTIF